jgi:hypothetical protein
MDMSIPSQHRTPLFAQWVSGYFQHGDLTTRDSNVISVVPSTSRLPSIWTFTTEEKEDMIEAGPSQELAVAFSTEQQANMIHRQVCFEVNELLPKMKHVFVTGDATVAEVIQSWWCMEEECQQHGAENIQFVVVPGANHFVSFPLLEIRR